MPKLTQLQCLPYLINIFKFPNFFNQCLFPGKNKLYLLDQGVIGVLKNIFENHFQRRGLDLVHSEIALIAVAVIRHLSKTRKF